MNLGESVIAITAIVGAVVIVVGALIAALWPLWVALAAIKYLAG